MSVCQHRAEFTGRNSTAARHWINAIARRISIRHRKGRRRQREVVLKIDPVNHPWTAGVNLDDLRILHERIRRLLPLAQVVLIVAEAGCCGLGSHPEPEVAKMLGLSGVSQVKGILGKARGTLREGWPA